MEDIITPTSDDDFLGANKRFWGLFKHLKTDIKGVPPLKHQGKLISNAAGIRQLFWTATASLCLQVKKP